MVEVQRANVFLTISEDEVDKYVAKGFSIVDPVTGKVIKQSIPNDLRELQKAYSEHEELIKKLKSENASLKSLLQQEREKAPAAPKGEKKVAEPEDDWGDDWDSAEQIEEKPKKGKKSKS